MPVPQSLLVGRWWWAVTALAAFGFAASFFANSTKRPAAEAPGLVGAGIALVGFGLLVSYAVVQLWRGKLSGRLSLSWCGLIIGLPLLTRGFRFGFFAALILIGVALLWTPGSIKYFAPQSKAAREVRRAERLARKNGR
ncbi:hypothetical protein CQ018_02510 [Arthrobacter sp. MYb227]|nr:hypothetical protein CQ018_02510 [Arthrobacter sp. MYb227]